MSLSHRRRFRKKCNWKSEKKGLENWANQSAWTLICAQELGLVDNLNQSSPISQQVLPAEIRDDLVSTNFDTVVVIDPYGDRLPYEVDCSKMYEYNNIETDEGIEQDGSEENSLVICEEPKNSSGTSEENGLIICEEPKDSFGAPIALQHPENGLPVVNGNVELMEIEETDDPSGKQVLAEVTIDSNAVDVEIPVIDSDINNYTNVQTTKETEKRFEPNGAKEIKKKKRNRDPLGYVNKTYKGINKIELEQKLYEENLKLYRTNERKLTRGVIKSVHEEKVPQKKGNMLKQIKRSKQHHQAGEELPKFKKGQMVWGFCRGWWPALIIDSEDAGMITMNEATQYVFWIQENQISELSLKNISLFSEHFELLVKVLNNSKPITRKYKACEGIIDLLYEKFLFPRTKPYGKWVEKHFHSIKHNLDSIIYFPYPAIIEKKLNELKIINAPKVAKYLQEEKKKRLSPTENLISNNTLNDKSSNFISLSADDRLALKDQKIGSIVWSKMSGHKWWPAMIVDFQDGGMKEPKYKHQWVMWYGDFKVSQVDIESFKFFRSGFQSTVEYKVTIKDYLEKINNEIIGNDKHKIKQLLYKEAVLQASKDYCSRLGFQTTNWTIKDIINWLESNENINETSSSVTRYEYSDIISKNLCLRKISVDEGSRKDDIENSSDLKKVKEGKLKIESMCLICLMSDVEFVQEHPFFTGRLCVGCFDEYLPIIFTFGDDGKHYYCCLCGGCGLIIICSKPSCPLVYCTACLKYLICPDYYERIITQDPWNCFFCEEKQVFEGIVKPRPDWKKQNKLLLKSPPRDAVNPILNSDGTKRRIRVLSLFDGISTGLLALKELKIEVEVYYASEIDYDAIKVSHKNFPTEVQRLGDVRNISKKKIEEIAPIDLLIGGSPCNDLSIANPQRKGLDDPAGSGILFYEFLRIKQLIEKANKGCHLFWFYENVASMPGKCRKQISECFGCDPDIIDSAQFSAQHRVRLYWNNLPIGLESFKSPVLQDMLDPHCGRLALVKKIRTITTNRNSLREGKKHSLKPITMNGVPDVLRMSELERIFVLPPHYTDANINLSTRHKLIGKSWRVPTILAIMQHLCK